MVSRFHAGDGHGGSAAEGHVVVTRGETVSSVDLDAR